MVSPDSRDTACPLSGRNSTYRPVQISGTGSRLKTPGRHSDGGGLYLSIDGDGRRRWVFLYVRRGRRVELGLGGGRDMALASARTEATGLRAMLVNGEDPKAA